MTKFNAGDKVPYKGKICTIKTASKDFSNGNVTYRLEESPDEMVNESELVDSIDVKKVDSIDVKKVEFGQALLDYEQEKDLTEEVAEDEIDEVMPEIKRGKHK